MTKAYRGPLAILAALLLCAVTTTTAVIAHELHGRNLVAASLRSPPSAVEEAGPEPDPCEDAGGGTEESIS